MVLNLKFGELREKLVNSERVWRIEREFGERREYFENSERILRIQREFGELRIVKREIKD